jgi:hypothetical protein
MSTSKASKKTKDATGSKTSAVTATQHSTKDAAAIEKASKEGRALEKLIARHGQIDADHRAAYDELISDEDRAALGARTRGPAVFREAVEWCVQIAEAFGKYPARVKAHYAETRFAYFLERTALLGAAVEAQQAHRGQQGSTRSTTAEREEAAREARKALLSSLRGFAGRRSAERTALSLSLGQTDNINAIGASIRALAALGAEWLARPGTTAKIQCVSAGLTGAGVAAALAAADALTGAATESTLAGRRPSADSPEVNLVEGAVLHEMDEAQRCFDEAHTATQLIRRLSPGPATRHVLGAKSASKTAATPANGTTDAAPPAATKNK